MHVCGDTSIHAYLSCAFSWQLAMTIWCAGICDLKMIAKLAK